MSYKRCRHRALLARVLVLSGSGAWISAELVKQHADLWDTGSSGGLLASMCRAAGGAGFDCSGALRGPWSEINIPKPFASRGGPPSAQKVTVPVAFVGLSYFVFMGVWFAFVGQPRKCGHGWYKLPLLVGALGAATSLLLLGVMAVGAAPWCLSCLAVHTINLLMVLLIWRLVRRKPAGVDAALAGSLPPQRVAAMTLTFREVRTMVTFALIVIAGLWFYRRERIGLQQTVNKLLPYKALVTSLQEDTEFLMREFLAQEHHDIPGRSGVSALAAASNRARLVVFTDFDCAACNCLARGSLRNAIRSFGGELEVVVRHFPLSSVCNDAVTSDIHPNACEAAYAAEAARLQGGENAFRRMQSLLFAHADELGHALYRELSTRLELDADRLVLDMESPEVRRSVETDIAVGKRLGVNATPTLFLNGRRVTQLYRTPQFWDAAAAWWAASAVPAQVKTVGYGGDPEDDEVCLEQQEAPGGS